MIRRLALALIVVLLSQGWALAQEPLSADAAGPNLLHVRFSLAGKPVEVRNGGVLAMHPDVPFRVLEAKTDAWLDFGLRIRLQGMPQVDLNAFHTLAELLGAKVYEEPSVLVQVLKNGQVLGEVRLEASLLPIDWLRRAQEADSLEQKISFTQKAWQLTPDDRLLLTRLVDLLVEAKRYQEALELLEEQSLERDDERLLRQLADLYERAGQKDKAAATLSKLAAESPRDQALLARLAVLYEDLERWEEAAQVLGRLLEGQTGPQRGETFLKLANVLERAGKKKEAAQALEHASRLKPADPQLWQRLAQSRRASGDLPGAIASLKRVVELQPSRQGPRLELAEALLAAGDKRGAAEQLRQAARLTPADAALWLRLARLQEELGDKSGLAQSYQRLADLKPNQPDILYNLAVIALERDNLPEALGYLEKALAAKPGDREIREAMLDVLTQMGRWEAAAKLAGELIAEKPDAKVVLRIYPSFAQNRPDQLAELLDALIKAGSQEVKIYETRAALALDQKDNQAAIQALEQGVKAHPQALDLRWSLAELLETEGQNAKALEQLGAILDQRPDYPGAEDRYLQLKTSSLQSGGDGKKP